MEVYHSWNHRLVEIVIFGGCKLDNWDNKLIGIFESGTILSDDLAPCWSSQTKLVRRTYLFNFTRTEYFIKEYTRYTTVTTLLKFVITCPHITSKHVNNGLIIIKARMNEMIVREQI